MKLIKPIALLLPLLFAAMCSFAQQQEIVKILNKELELEMKRQFKSPDFDGDTLVVAQPYRIQGNVLSVAFQKKDYYDSTCYIHRQEVALDKITSIVKDINVIFETSDDAVKITDSTVNASPGIPAVKKHTYNLFFLHLAYEKNNEDLAEQLIKAFKKAGYTIDKRFWAD